MATLGRLVLDRFMTSSVRPADEMANLLTHAAGFLLSLVAAVQLMQRVTSASAAVKIACGVYSVSLLLVYGSSTLSHLFYDTQWRRRFRTLDQACIFLLIAGTYTPLGVIYLDHGWWRLLLIVMWVSAFAGVLRVVQVQDLSATDKVFFGLIGFLPVIAIAELARQASTSLVVWIVAGGACYCLGAIFLRLSARIRYSHAVWHLFVVAGSACHYWAILLAVTSR